MALDLTSLDFAMKELYDGNEVENLTYEMRPTLAIMPKEEDFFGDVKPIPVIYGNPQGRSADFTRARTRGVATNTLGVKFNLTRVKDYSIAFIDNETMEASENDKGAFVKGIKTEVDGAINSLSNSFASKLFRTGFGEIGVVGAVATNTITLANINDIVNFEVGMELMISTSVNAAVLRAVGTSTNGLIVTGVNRQTGVLTFGANVTDATNGIPATAANDFIFIRGDRQDSATPTALALSGIEAWVPTATPGAGLFFGVNRTADVTRLGGLRLDGRALPLEEALIDGAMAVYREGGKLSHYIMSPGRFGSLEKALGAKVQYIDVQANADVGFRGIRIVGPHGDITVLADPFCPDNNIYGLTLSTWVIKSLKKLFRPTIKNGSSSYQYIDNTTADGVEVRFGYYANVACNAPGRNINIQVG